MQDRGGKPISCRNADGELRNGYPNVVYGDGMTYERRQAYFRLRTSSSGPWDAPSSVGPGVLPVHVLGGGET